MPSSPAENVQYVYDDAALGNKGVGHLTRITDAPGASDLSYDARGNVIREARLIAGRTYVTGFAWDAADNLIRLSYPSGRVVSYARDAQGRVSGITRQDPAMAAAVVASNIAYAPFGPLAGITFGNGVALTQTYDQDYRLRRIQAAGANGMELAYSYDAADNITAIRELPNPNFNQDFAYDDLNRLIWARGRYNTVTYAYDVGGNRIAHRYGDYTQPVMNDVHSIAPGSNRLLQVSGAVTRSFAYDAAGNVANDNRPGASYSYAHNAAGDLASVTLGAAELASYTSDARHLRAIKRVPGGAFPQVDFIYDGEGRLLAEHDGISGAPLREYIWSDDLPVAMANRLEGAAASPYYIHADHLGRPRKLTDQAGAVVWDGAFAPFGEAHYLDASITQNLRFPGQYADAETGALSYNWHRTYDPRLGRYLQSDPIGLAGGINTYAYAEGNPLRYTDPQGLNPIAGAIAGSPAGPAGAAVGAAVGLGLSIGAAAILSAILGPDDPADKAKADAQKAEEECRRKNCQALKDSILKTCSSLTGKKRFRCFAAANESYRQCMED